MRKRSKQRVEVQHAKQEYASIDAEEFIRKALQDARSAPQGVMLRILLDKGTVEERIYIAHELIKVNNIKLFIQKDFLQRIKNLSNEEPAFVELSNKLKSFIRQKSISILDDMLHPPQPSWCIKKQLSDDAYAFLLQHYEDYIIYYSEQMSAQSRKKEPTPSCCCTCSIS